MSTPSELWALGGTQRPASFANWGTKISDDVVSATANVDKLTSMRIDPRDSGAVGDGSTDDSAALTAAFVAAWGVTPRTVVMPPGVFLAKNVTVPSNVRIVGSGTSTILRRPSGGSGVVLNIQGGSVQIRDLVIEANSAGGGSLGSGAIDSSGFSDVSLSNVTIIDAVNFGVRLNNGSRLVIDRVKIINPVRHGIVIQSTTGAENDDVSITNCVIDRSSLAPDTSSNHGMLVRGSDATGVRVLRNVRIANNLCRQPVGSTHGIGIEAWASYLTVTGNVCTGGAMGISTGSDAVGVAVTGNACKENSVIGIEIIATQMAGSAYAGVCTGNTIDGRGICSVGISCSTVAGPDEVLIAGNTIVGFVSSGIHVTGPRRLVVSTNYLRWDSSISAGATTWGIRIDSPGRSSGLKARVTCNGNHIDGMVADNASYGIQVTASNDADVVYSVMVATNHIYDVTHGVGLVAAIAISPTGQVSNNHIEAATLDVQKIATSGGDLTGVVESNNT